MLSVVQNLTPCLWVPQANWYRATQYCRYHGMHLASISSQEENDKLEKHIRDYGEENVCKMNFAKYDTLNVIQ